MPPRPHPVLVYTALRLLMLVVVTGLLALTGLRGFPLLALALVVSGLLSLVLLRRTRGDVSARLVERRTAPPAAPADPVAAPRRRRSLRERLDEGAASEDDD